MRLVAGSKPHPKAVRSVRQQQQQLGLTKHTPKCTHNKICQAMGVDRVVAVDLHCGQIQGFFGPRVPVDNLDGGTVGVSYFGDKDLHNPGKKAKEGRC